MNNDELRHHGVKGQKWGVRNGPPYPLDGDVKSESKKIRKKLYKLEKRAGSAYTAASGLREKKSYYDKKIYKKILKGKDATKLLKKSGILSLKIKDLDSNTKKYNKEIKQTLASIPKELDYGVVPRGRIYRTNVNKAGFKEINKKHGGDKFRDGLSSVYFSSFRGNAYYVGPKNKERATYLNKKVGSRTPIHTEYR